MTSRTAAESGLTALLGQALRTSSTRDRWIVAEDEQWCRVAARHGRGRDQGWKLHVSATSVSAPAVLARALPVLLPAASAFKFARSLDRVDALNTRGTPRGSSGKFLTVYPRDDGEAVRLAEELHRVTAGLTGPRILSDRAYRPGSLVHYRYGSFADRRVLSDTGLLIRYVEDPDGNLVEDERTGRYAPPAWAWCPFPAPAPPVEQTPGPLLLGGRFAVREAIRHTNKGGVYRATDLRTGDPVVIKEARPHVEAGADGRDIRDWLRTEAAMLEEFRGLGLAPEPLALIEVGEHLFLALEEIPGRTLRTWVAEHFRDAGTARYRADALPMVERVMRLLARVHEHGLVLRDFTPGNIMVRPDGELRLIDLELAVHRAAPGPPTRLGTPGFSAPERLTGAPVTPAADCYSLGAVACLILIGTIPNLLGEPDDERLAAWLAARTADLDLPGGVVPMLRGLMRQDPAGRWDLVMARAALTRRTVRAAPADSPVNPVTGIVDHLLASMTPDDETRLWPVSVRAGEADPCVVQQGAAGVLAVLTRYFTLTGDPRLPEVISTAGHWIARRARTGRPGLHFGTRGIAWALHDAGHAVGDRRLTDRAIDLALAPLPDTPGHDITHGTAGSGLAAVHLWHRTGDRRLADLAADAADRLAAAVDREGWAVPAEPGARPYLGFAHGTAGIGSFLLEAARVAPRAGYRQLAEMAGEDLVAHAVLTGDSARWPARPGDPPTAPYWCHGAGGVGTFLVRLWQSTGDDRFGDLARRSARTVREHASRAPLGQCHGLAGNGDFLLDLADATGDPAYRAEADDLARMILTERDGADFPTEYGEVSAGWSDGSAGILAFLLRLWHPTTRLWMVSAPS